MISTLLKEFGAVTGGVGVKFQNRRAWLAPPHRAPSLVLFCCERKNARYSLKSGWKKEKKRSRTWKVAKQLATGASGLKHTTIESKKRKKGIIYSSRDSHFWPTELSVWIEKNKHTPRTVEKKIQRKKSQFRMKIWPKKENYEPSNGWKERSLCKGPLRVWCRAWFGPPQQGAEVIYCFEFSISQKYFFSKVMLEENVHSRLIVNLTLSYENCDFRISLLLSLLHLFSTLNLDFFVSHWSVKSFF